LFSEKNYFICIIEIAAKTTMTDSDHLVHFQLRLCYIYQVEMFTEYLKCLDRIGVLELNFT